MNKNILSQEMLDELKSQIGTEMFKINIELNEELIKMFWNMD